MKKLLLMLLLSFLVSPAFAYQSTINPVQPVQGAPLASAPVRNNFLAAYNDINNLYTLLGVGNLPLSPTQGGTGISNAVGNTITLGGPVLTRGNFTLSGAYNSTFTFTGVTNVTFPTSGTLLTSSTAVTSFTGDGTILNNSASVGAVTASLANAGAGTLLGNATSSAATPTYTSTPQLGKSGTLGSVTMGNATSGLLTLEPATGALGTVTVSIPAATDTLVNLASTQSLTNKSITGSEINSGTVGPTYGGTGVNNGSSTITIGGNVTFSGANTFTGTLTGTTAVTFPTSGTLATTATANVASVSNSDGTLTVSPTTGAVVASIALGHANTWSGVQTYTNSDIALLGSSTGKTTFTSANAGASNFTLTFPAVTDTLAALGTAQTWSAVQTYTNSDIALLGSSTGKTTLTSANAGASNFTLTLPAVTDTVGVLGTAQTWSAVQTYTNSDIALLGSSTGKTTFTSANAGSSSFTLTFPAVTDTLATLNTAQTFGATQSVTPTTLSISTATFTPTFATSNNFNITLVHASCPCTVANPSSGIVAGTSGMFVINQSATGSDTIGTWGSDYKFSGGTAPTLSTAAGAVDLLPWYVIDSTHIAVGFNANFK